MSNVLQQPRTAHHDSVEPYSVAHVAPIFLSFRSPTTLGAVEKQLRYLTELSNMSISSLDHEYPDSYRLKLDVHYDRDPVRGFYEDVFPAYDASFYSNFPLQSGQ